MVTKISDLISDMAHQFREAGIDTPILDARLLVQEVLGLTREQLLMKNQIDILDTQSDLLKKMTRRRRNREPVSRIIGKRGFWKSEFKVSPETLDPRPDSESLVEAVLKIADRSLPLTILDLGTGTGCLLLSLLQDLPKATGVGVDISAGALEVARQNAKDLGLSDRADFVNKDWADMVPGQTFDIVISNPPYISEAEKADLAPEVREYDPPQALFGGQDGLECYRIIINKLNIFLKSSGKVFFEIGSTQKDSVNGILAAGGLRVLQTFPDLAGHDRCIMAEWKAGY